MARDSLFKVYSRSGTRWLEPKAAQYQAATEYRNRHYGQAEMLVSVEKFKGQIKVCLKALQASPSLCHLDYYDDTKLIEKSKMPEQLLQPKEARGFQTLLNYRSEPPQEVKLRKILDGSLDSEISDLVKNRIILIGALKQQDKHFTPYSTGQWSPQMSGVVVQAQMASQIVSVVLNNRPLLWWWPEWGEILWVASWSIVGGVLVWRWRSPIPLGLAIGSAIAILYVLCFILLLKSGWVPFVPSALALVFTSGSLVIYTTYGLEKK